MTPAAARRLAEMADQSMLPGVVDIAPAPPARRVPVRAHLRTIVSETVVATGAEQRDAALNAHESREVTHRAIAYVRQQLVALYRSRQAASPFASDHFVTADDIETVLHDWAECPDEAKRSHGPQLWRGAVFRGKGWRHAGPDVPAKRKHMKATALPTWAPVDPTSEAP